MSIEKILVIDDEPLMCQFLKEMFSRKGYEIFLADNGKKALGYIKDNHFDLVLTDMKLPDFSGMEILKSIKESSPSTIVIVMTAFGSIENAVDAMKIGAFHYLLKPFTPDALEAVIEKAIQHYALVQENAFLKEEISSKIKQSRVIAESPVMKKILEEAVRIAKSNASVFIHGESGTGKEMIAGTIHAHSLRHERPYIKVNCAAIPDTLVESEFFGYEKGAFTGALAKKPGRFELAHGGTLLLDEITEIPTTVQPKLLRVLQEKEFERVGGTKSISVDVRIISTSNRNLKEAINEKTFREDLYYRLNVVPIHLPPLRDRREDIIPLSSYFLEKFCQENRKKSKKITFEAEKKLLNYPWPGNIRELANALERVVVLDSSQLIDATHLYIE